MLRARTLLVATGLTDVLPDVPGVAERFGRDAIHCPFCHGFEVRDRPLAVYYFGQDEGEKRRVLDRTISGGATVHLVLDESVTHGCLL